MNEKMNENQPYFFCGIGGIGMMPLALLTHAMGFTVHGSDRSRDQGRTPEKYAELERLGIKLFPQDGSGVDASTGAVIVSSAVEENVPDYVAAKNAHVPVLLRAELLTRFFNRTQSRIAVAGTSGKSTTTGMIGWILSAAGKDPTIFSGAIMKNFVRPDFPLASAIKGAGQIFVGETDESDGSIALWNPTIAVLNNIQPEHLPIEKLRTLFGDFVQKAAQVVTNLDNSETAALLPTLKTSKSVLTFSLKDNTADFFASDIVHTQHGVDFNLHTGGTTYPVKLQVPGEHNVANALSALAATSQLVSTAEAVRYLATFTGMKRRLEVIGTANGITVLDDISQNPVNIMSNMRALHMHPGRLLLLFQPHGYGVNNRDREWFIDGLTQALRPDDILYMTDPLYLGGTVNPKYRTSDVVTDPIRANGRNAVYRPTRDECLTELLKVVQPGDRIVVMGARDDSLHQFAHGILSTLKQRSAA